MQIPKQVRIALLNAIKLSVDRNNIHMNKQVVLNFTKYIGVWKKMSQPLIGQPIVMHDESLNGLGKFAQTFTIK